jgi:REP element-mobilizing transposase RayT
MTYNPDKHHRHSIRLKDYDYSQAGAYFVTICTWQRECIFGEIVAGEMVLNDTGRIVLAEWDKTPTMRPNAELDRFVIMPNHLHGIIVLHNIVGAHCMRPYHDNIEQQNRVHISAPLQKQSGSIGITNGSSGTKMNCPVPVNT